MTKTSKRLISVLICLTLVLAMLPMAVFAETATTIYVQPNSNWLTDGARFAAYFFGNGETWLDCTDPDGDGIYEVAVPAGYTSVIFCRMNPADTTNSWDTKWNQTSDQTVPTDDKVVYVVSGWDKGAGQWITYGGEVEPTETAYYLVGSMNGWAAADSCKMTKNDDGTYSISMALTAGDYEYKITDSDGNWSPDPNMTLTVNTDCTVTFTLTLGADLASSTVTATGSGVGEGEVEEPVPVVYDYYVAGGAGLCGAEWDPAQNQMTKGEDGLYTITFTDVAAGTYEYKVTTGSWETPSYGYDGNNCSVTTEAWLSNVTITFNEETTEITASVEVAVATEPGANDIKWQVANGATAADATTNVRFVTSVDSLDYQNVTFTITLAGETAVYDCETVYEKLIAGDQTIDSAATVFGDGAAYFVAFTMENLPQEYYNSEIAVTVTWTDMEGNSTSSETRTIVVADALA